MHECYLNAAPHFLNNTTIVSHKDVYIFNFTTTASSYSNISGIMAAITITCLTLILTRTNNAKDIPKLEFSVQIFLMSFFGWIFAAFEYALVAGLDTTKTCAISSYLIGLISIITITSLAYLFIGFLLFFKENNLLKVKNTVKYIFVIMVVILHFEVLFTLKDTMETLGKIDNSFLVNLGIIILIIFLLSMVVLKRLVKKHFEKVFKISSFLFLGAIIILYFLISYYSYLPTMEEVPFTNLYIIVVIFCLIFYPATAIGLFFDNETT